MVAILTAIDVQCVQSGLVIILRWLPMSDIKTAPIAIRYIVYNMFDNKCARDALTASYSCCTTHHTLVLQR